MKRLLQLVIAIAISAVCVWVSMKEVDLHLVATALAHANRLGFVAVMIITIFAFWVRAFRWNYFLRTDKRVPLTNLFSATMIGFMANDYVNRTLQVGNQTVLSNYGATAPHRFVRRVQ